MSRILQKSTLLILLAVGSMLIGSCGGGQVQGPATQVRIGVVLTLSGNGSAAGDYTLKAIQLAVKEQNARGGLLGRQISLDVQDSKGDPKTAIDIIKRMMDSSERPLIVCSNTSGVSLAIKPETEKGKVILLASAATDKLLEQSAYTLRSYVDSTQISEAVLKAVDSKSLGVFFANNEFGSSVSRKVAEKSSTLSTSIKFNVPYDDKELDYKSLIAALEIKSVQSIYVVGLGKSLGAFVKQLREAGYEGLIIGDPLFNNPDTLTAAGTAANGVALLDYLFDPKSDQEPVRSFVQSYTKEFSSEPANLSAITYDAINLIFTRINEDNSVNPDLLMPKLKDGLIQNGVAGSSKVVNGSINYPLVFRPKN